MSAGSNILRDEPPGCFSPVRRVVWLVQATRWFASCERLFEPEEATTINYPYPLAALYHALFSRLNRPGVGAGHQAEDQRAREPPRPPRNMRLRDCPGPPITTPEFSGVHDQNTIPRVLSRMDANDIYMC